MVLCEELAGRAETADHFHGRSRRLSAGAEQFFGLVLVKAVMFIILAFRAVFPAQLPVLFRVFYFCGVSVTHAVYRGRY